MSVLLVVVLQGSFTYAPFMEELFDTRPIDLLHGEEIRGSRSSSSCSWRVRSW